MSYYYGPDGSKIAVDDHSSDAEKQAAQEQWNKDHGIAANGGMMAQFVGGAPGQTGVPAPSGSLDQIKQDLQGPQVTPEQEQAARQAAAAKAEAEARAEQERKLNAHYQYGGYEGGARDAANVYAWKGDDAEKRQGEQINYYDAQADRFNNGQARLGQTSIAEAMRQRALGRTPSIASLEADRNINRANAEQTSLAASARGPAALALAQQQAAANIANVDSTISNTAQINAANERRQDETAAFGAQTGLRQGDQAQQAADAQQAQAQAAINAQQRAQNDAYANANYDRSVGINKAQLDAQMHQVDTATGQATAAANRDAAKSMHDEDRADKYIAPIVGAGATAGGILLMSALGGGGGKSNAAAENYPGGSSPGPGGYNGNAPADGSLNPATSGGEYGGGTYGDGTPKPLAKGGPMRAGETYLVGEKGPEIVIPKKDGYVLTAEQSHPLLQETRDLGEIDEPVRDLGEIDEPVRDLGDVDAPRFAPARMRGPNARDAGEIDTYREPVSFERHNSPDLDRRIADMMAAQKAQDTMLGEPAVGRHPLLAEEPQPNRVDAMLDGIHPLSYHYKDAWQEPRSRPTGGRYLGISAQDLEAVPEVGPQMVSDGPRGKQIESGPTLSAAMAGIARLNERLRSVEGRDAEGTLDGYRASLDAGPSVGRRMPGSMTSDITAKTDISNEGAMPSPSRAAYDMAQANATSPALPGPQRQLPGPQLPGPQSQLPGPQTQLPGPQAPAALPGPQRAPTLPGPQRAPTLASLYGQQTAALPGPQRALPGPQRSAYGFTSDIKAKDDVVSEGAHPLIADGVSGPRARVGEAPGGRAASTVVARQPVVFVREHPLASSPLADTAVEISHAPPIPGAVPGMMDPAKTIQGVGQAASLAAEGYERGGRPALAAIRRRVENGIDETARRGADTYRAVTGNAQRAPTLANIEDGGRR